MSTITGTYYSEIILTIANSPLVIASSAVVTTFFDAVYGPPTQAWTVANAGVIGSGGNHGIFLASGGMVTNTGKIEGAKGGVVISGAGTITNSGTISTVGLGAGSVFDNKASGQIETEVFVSTGMVTNAGTIGLPLTSGSMVFGGDGSLDNSGLIGGVQALTGNITLTNSGTILSIGDFGGKVTNTGTIETELALQSGSVDNQGLVGGYGISFGLHLGNVSNAGTAAAVALGAGGYLHNDGTIKGSVLASSVVPGASGTVVNTGGIGGVTLVSGGSVNNIGLINGSYGVRIKGGSGTVSNSSFIIGTHAGILLLSSGSVDNEAGLIEGDSGILFGSYTNEVTNKAAITGTAQSGVGVDLFRGTIDNSGGVIQGFDGIVVVSNGTVLNTGTILGAASSNAAGVILVSGSLSNAGLIEGYDGVRVSSSVTVTNAGTIMATATTLGQGVSLGSGGSVDNSGHITAYLTAVHASGSAGTITNSGTINATSTSGIGVNLQEGGTVTNTSAGQINGHTGIYIGHASGAITNSGKILGVSLGVVLANGGSVDNTSAALIQGYGGIEIANSAGTVTNFGTIGATGTSDGFGVDLDGGSVDNTSAALIQGSDGIVVDYDPGIVTNAGTIMATATTLGHGVKLDAGGTLVDSGTISGATAIYLGGTANNLLVLEAGYRIVGAIAGGAGATNTLELSGAYGALTVNYDNLGLSNFGNVLFSPSGQATLAVSDISGVLPVTIMGFDNDTDIIDLTAIGTDGVISNFDTIADLVTVTGSLGSVTLQLDSSDATSLTTQSDNGSGTDLIACFCRGTLILTDGGERPVEQLAIGDRIISASGRLEPIKWIGRRSYEPRFVAGNGTVLPVRIAAGALGDGLPRRDLWLSPEHALYIDGTLVAAHLLVNDTSIVQADRVDALEYFHIELGAHDIIIAEGVPAESYVECDNRDMFHNAAEFARLYPNDQRPSGAFCAPRLEATSSELARIRTMIVVRAQAAAA